MTSGSKKLWIRFRKCGAVNDCSMERMERISRFKISGNEELVGITHHKNPPDIAKIFPTALISKAILSSSCITDYWHVSNWIRENFPAFYCTGALCSHTLVSRWPMYPSDGLEWNRTNRVSQHVGRGDNSVKLGTAIYVSMVLTHEGTFEEPRSWLKALWASLHRIEAGPGMNLHCPRSLPL